MIRTLARRLGLAAVVGALAAGALAAPAAAAGRGTVQGTYSTDAGAPIAGAAVSAYSADYDWLRDATTDAQGRFTLRNVTAGGIKLQFQNNGIEQWAHRAADFDSADTFTLAENQTLTVSDRQLPTGRITGLMEEPGGGPASFYTVEAYRADGALRTYAYADETGRYAMEVLPGRYTVSFQREHTRQWAYRKTDEESAETFTVEAGATVAVNDTFLPTGALVGGLSTADGAPLPDANVALHRPHDPADEDGTAVVAETNTDEDGHYAFGGVLPGAYRVSFAVGDGPRQWVRGTVDPAQATAFTVTAGETTVVDDRQLRPATVRGTLTDRSGAPVAEHVVRVGVDDENGDSYDTTTGADGTWSVDGLFPGRYVVSFENPESTRRQYAYGKGNPAAAARIDVAQGATVTVDDTWLPGAALAVIPVDAVTGAPVSDFCVRLWSIDRDECTDGSTLTLTDLPEGSFEAEVDPRGNGFYLGGGELPVTLVPGRTTTLSVPLQQGGKAAVTVTDAVTGVPVADTCLVLRRPGTGGLGDGYQSCTNAAGKAVTEAMATGTYQVFAVARPGYGHQWVGKNGGTGDQREAARITLRPGRITKAPAVRLDKAGTITGTVTGDDGQPIAGVDVAFSAWDYGAGPSWATDTDSAGRYTIDELGPYSWPLVFTAHGYARQWSGGGGNRFQAAGVAVTAGGRTTFDMALARGSVLRGTVSVPDGLPVRSWRLTAVNAVTGDPVAVADHSLLANGDYTAPIAGGQQVKIRWYVSGANLWQDGWYDGAADQASATKVTVPGTGTKKLNLTIGR